MVNKQTTNTVGIKNHKTDINSNFDALNDQNAIY